MGATVGTRTRPSLAVPIHGLSVVALAVVSSYFAYLWGSVTVNPAEVLAPFLFWYGIAFILLAYPLRPALSIFTRQVRTVFGASVFAVYLVIHVFLYGFLLEGILGSFAGRALLSSGAGVSLTTTVFAPPSATNALLALWYNPWITLTIPPLLSAALSLYSLMIALVIDILIIANIGKTRELGKVCSTGTRSRSMVLFPALGIALGASCCLSVPLLVTVAVPTAAALSSLLWVYDATYFLFPPFAVVLLYLNLYSVNRITANLKIGAGDGDALSAIANPGSVSPDLK
ncbi:MAG: hypothetical protein OK449_03255 [Thaumarchaeota archaeon]|jgi:hypothetical protein|nr:hypothetical protein [Nitrososphaerota archaeon]